LGGTEDQKREWFGKVCSSDPGDLYIGSWACTEPQGLVNVDIDGLFSGTAELPSLGGLSIPLVTVAKPEGNDYIINGQKCFITGGGVAKVCILLANTPEGAGHFIVPTDTPGFSVGKIEDMMGHRCMNDAELFFDNVRVPRENLIGGSPNGLIELLGTVGYSDTWVGALAVGVGRAAYEAALEYSRIRTLGGKPIFRLQAVGMMIADMFLELEAARALVWKSLWVNDTQDAPDSKLAAAAKILASDTAMRVTTNAVQVYGGAGYMKENPVEKYMRDAKVTQIYEGTNQLLRILISMLLGFGM
jgi:alkylation response protein AidB-like acyl-CoA dehydrogenase